MSYESIFKKLSETHLSMSPPLRDTLQRVRETGLHKVAAQEHGVPSFGIKEAAEVLGRRLVFNRLKQEKIASGLAALGALSCQGDVKLASIGSRMMQMGGKALKRAKPPPIPAAAMRGAQKGSPTLMSGGKNLMRSGAKPPPIPAAARGPASAETQALLHDIHGMGTSAETTRAIQDLLSMAPPGRSVTASLRPMDFSKMAKMYKLMSPVM